MSDIFERVSGEQDFFKKILAKIPGFKGYIERGDRRMSDKLLRENVANEFEALYQRISSLQRDLISQGEISYVDDLEAAALKLRQFIDRVRTASYGYAGIFDAIKIREEELEQVYQYDYALLALSDDVRSAIDNVETSMGTEGFDAAIRHLTSVSQQCVDAFNKRSEVMKGITTEG
jgi:hypothetical protein